MHEEGYKRIVEIAAPPAKVFDALTKGVHRWWTTSADDASVVGETASFRFDGTYNRMLIVELVPNYRVVWSCIEQLHLHEALSISNEWVGTKLIWDIRATSSGTRLTFEHRGLIPQLDCYEICEGGWDYYLHSLKSYLESGTGDPYLHSKGFDIAWELP